MPSTNQISTFTNILVQKCNFIASLKKAHQLHALILTSAIPTSYQTPYLHNNLLSMYAKCGSIFHSQQVFDKMPLRNIISYNSLIAAYAHHPDLSSSAFEILAKMRYDCFQPNGSTFTSLLQAATSSEDWFVGFALHGQIVKSGLLFDTCVQTALIGLYSDFGVLSSANQLFESILVKDVVAWNCFISGNLKNNMIGEGLHLFRTMLMSSVRPTEFTYSMVLNACARLGFYACGQLTHGQVIKTGVPSDLRLQNALVDMYSHCADTQSAFDVFSKIKNPDLVSWNAMLAGYAENHEVGKAIDLLNRLEHLSAHKPDEYTFAAVFSATKEYPVSLYGEPLHARAIASGWDKSVFVGSPLVSMYFKHGRIESAERVFHSIPKKDVVLWTEMITGYSKMIDGENAIKFFYNMKKEGHKIDSFSLSSALSACADLATSKPGEMLHCQAIRTGYDSEMSVCGSLTDLYAKIGDLQAAEAIFAKVKNPDLKCWNSMIGGYSYHGKAAEAMKLFDELLARCLEPDHVTYISLLSACSHCGLVERGKYLWNYMKKQGLALNLKHYSSMVSLLSRAGLLEEAVEIINESQLNENHLELWRIVLGSSVTNRNLLMGLRAGERVLQINAHDSATHSLLSNLHAAAGRWDGVMEVRKRIRGMMLEKDPGLSWIESAKSLDVFSSGDQSHPRIEEVKAQLQILQRSMNLWKEIDEI